MSRDTLVGTTLAGYSIKDMVGEGGTSAVYRADHPQHGVVALKVLREKLRQDRTAVARFTREAKFGTRVQHPNVVTVHDVGGDGEYAWIAGEFVGGGTLAAWASERPRGWHELLAPLRDAASGIAAAHAAGLIHRALAAERVKVDPRFDPKQALEATARYLDIARDQLGDPLRIDVLPLLEELDHGDDVLGSERPGTDDDGVHGSIARRDGGRPLRRRARPRLGYETLPR